MAPKSRSPRVGTQVGDFILREQIGSGSFAFVHRAKNLRRGGYAAVKCVILAKLSESKKLKENLHAEIKIMKSVNHPHVVSLMDCRESPGEKPEYIYLVMEYCQLGDLSNFIKNRDSLPDLSSTLDAFKKYPNPKHGGLNEVFVRHFVKQLASALEFLHRKNLIHRDLKPQNVLVAPSSQARESANMFLPERLRKLQPIGVPSLPLLKIADFGFARILPPQGLAETLCGSPLYMAPEILAYKKYDAKADLWSFGALIYEMVTSKPPFRAGNHMELYRVIERANDQIRFPAEVSVSPDVKSLIRSLLKKKAVERISFEALFAQEVITGGIPGLVEADQTQMEALSQPELLQAAAMERTKSAEREENAKESIIKPASREVFVDAVAHPSDQIPIRPKAEQMATAPVGQVPQLSPKTVERIEKPSINRHATEMPPPLSPASASRPESLRRQSISQRQGLRTPPQAHQPQQQQQSSSAAAASPQMQTQLQQSPKQQQQQQQSDSRNVQERAAQDVADERDYVVVEKRAVEMNALADEFQASPRMQGHHRNSSASQKTARPSVSGFHPASAPTTTQYTSRTAHVSNVDRPDHLRRTSFEKRAKQTSASSALAKAINKAAGRLITIGGFAVSPPVGSRSGSSPIPTYGAFPAYQAQTPYMLMDDGKQSSSTGPHDEDSKALQAIEETATKSDVVYGFAQVKYMQLIPRAPSAADNGLGLRLESAGSQGGSGGGGGAEDGSSGGDLTADALVTICEEALVLYVRALGLLARAMDIAGLWWARRNRGESAEQQSSNTPSRDSRSANQYAAQRLNSVVQWVRGRFNETLEKATFVRLKLVDAQKRLPEDHPSHPSNQPETATTGNAVGQAMLKAAEAQAGDTPELQQMNLQGDVYISPGVTADRIMYQRAVEMFRGAALGELMSEDLPGCEISYITAIRMLEVVVERDPNGASEAGNKQEKASSIATAEKDISEDTLDPEDRESVNKMLREAKRRLYDLRKKMSNMQRRSSATPIPQRSPKPRPVSLSPAHASAR